MLLNRLTGRHLQHFLLNFSDHGPHLGGWACPKHKAIAPVFVIRLTGIFEVRQDLIDCYALEVGREEFRLLLSIAVCPVVVVGSLDLQLRCVSSSQVISCRVQFLRDHCYNSRLSRRKGCRSCLA